MTYGSNILAQRPFIDETVDLLDSAGIPISIISGGGTGAEQASKDMGCTENAQRFVYLRRHDAHFWFGSTQSGPMCLADDYDGCEHSNR